jgi:3-oxoacyl-[acyl-carrier protein] reductase
MELGLRGKAALITGASRGIGRAIAEALLREGASVCLCARGADDLKKTRAELDALGQVTAVAADVSTESGSRTAVQAAVSQLGRLDLLVNNVGGSRGTGAVDQVTAAQWGEVVAANLSSVFLASAPAIAWMKENGGGAIVNIGSIYGREYAKSAAYTAAKAGVVALTKEMAVDLAPFAIRVNCVAPGSIWFPGGSWDRRQQALWKARGGRGGGGVPLLGPGQLDQWSVPPRGWSAGARVLARRSRTASLLTEAVA